MESSSGAGAQKSEAVKIGTPARTLTYFKTVFLLATSRQNFDGLVAALGGKLTLGERAFQWEGTLAFRSLGGAHSWPNFPSRLSTYSQMVKIDHQSRTRRVFVTSRLAPELTTCVDVAALVSHAC